MNKMFKKSVVVVLQGRNMLRGDLDVLLNLSKLEAGKEFVSGS
jgi:hypothetical protein